MSLVAAQTAEATPADCPAPLRRFIWDIQSLVELDEGERTIRMIGGDLMARLVAGDDWLPDRFATPDAARHQQFTLYADAMERFSVVATILAPGQILPAVLDPVWEIIGVLRGSVSLSRLALAPDGALSTRAVTVLPQPTVASFSSENREIMRLRNEREDASSVVIHVFGGEMAQLDRYNFWPDGSRRHGPARYANATDAPPYDIYSIQARIAD